MKTFLSLLRKPPVGLEPDFADVPYREDHPLQVLDFWKSPVSSSDSLSPVLIFFHGGGFIRGRKFHSRLLREMREMGVATVAASYRLTRQRGITVADAMQDSLMIHDFIQKQAEPWGIDPRRIALTGKSSGGCIALWLAMTRKISGVVTYNSPTSIDPDLLVTEMGRKSIHPYWPIWSSMTDEWSMKGLRSEKVKKLISDYSPLNHVHNESPPLFLEYSKDLQHYRSGWLEALHCVRYGEMMRERYNSLGLSCVLSTPSKPPPLTAVEFLCDALDVQCR